MIRPSKQLIDSHLNHIEMIGTSKQREKDLVLEILALREEVKNAEGIVYEQVKRLKARDECIAAKDEALKLIEQGGNISKRLNWKLFMDKKGASDGI